MSDVAEVVADNVEEVVDGVVETLEVVRTNPAVVVAAGVIGLTLGGVGGYFIAKKRLESYYVDLAESEIQEAREFYQTVNKVKEDGSPLTPQDALAASDIPAEAAEALITYRGEETTYDELDEKLATNAYRRAAQKRAEAESAAKVVEAEKTVVETKDEVVETTKVRIFDIPEWDQEEEEAHRTEDEPYVISYMEFNEEDKDFDPSSYVFFEGDGVVVNENDMPLSDNDADAFIGLQNLERFGHGSRDRNTVYIRNYKLGMDFEVTRSEGTYVDEVAGLNEDVAGKNPSLKARREFRRGDG